MPTVVDLTGGDPPGASVTCRAMHFAGHWKPAHDFPNPLPLHTLAQVSAFLFRALRSKGPKPPSGTKLSVAPGVFIRSFLHAILYCLNTSNGQALQVSALSSDEASAFPHQRSPPTVLSTNLLTLTYCLLCV